MQLIRWPNLVIMALTMVMVRYFLMLPYFYAAGVGVLPAQSAFYLLILAVLFIAAGGYIINDINDLDIDMVNKPEKMIIGKYISSKNAHILYIVFTGMGLIMSLVLSVLFGQMHLSLVFLLMAGLMWFYARRYKRELIIGNLVIAFSSAMVVVIVWLFDVLFFTANPVLSASISPVMPVINKLVFAYALFALLASLIREIVKDMQDIKGDLRNECQTVPIKFGITVSRWVVMVLLLILLSLVVFWQFEMMQWGEMAVFGYLFLVDGLIIFSGFSLLQANDSKQYGQVSSVLKVLMIAGILSIPLIQLV